jgi:hypothetical protein
VRSPASTTGVLGGQPAGWAGLRRPHRPDGQLIDPAPKVRIDPDGGGIEACNRDHGLDIAPDTVTTNWCGDTLDASLATGNIMWDRQRAKEFDLDAAEKPSDEVWPREE